MSQILKFNGGSGPLPPEVATTYTADTGTAIPVANNLNLFSSIATDAIANNLTSFASGDTVTYALLPSINQPNTDASGNGVYSLGTLRFLHNYGTQNTFVGARAGNLTLDIASSHNNVAVGFRAGEAINTFAQNCVYIGSVCGLNLTDGFNTVAIGTGSLGAATTTVNGSTSIGNQSLTALTSGSLNTAIGNFSLGALLTGENNIAIGNNSGQLYVGSESSNIIIGNDGVAAENNTMRLGTTGTGAGQVSTTYIAGIAGVTVSNQATVVIDTTTGQLGTNEPFVVQGYVVANASPYVVGPTAYYITVDTSTIPITIQLPDAPTQYRSFIIKDSAGNAAVNNITVTTVSGVLLIDAATTFVMNTNYQSAQFLFDGFGYQIF